MGKDKHEGDIGGAADAGHVLEKIELLRDAIRRHDRLYYIEANPEISRPRLRPVAG